MTNENGVIEYVNTALQKINGYTREALLGQNISIFRYRYEGVPFFANHWDRILSGEQFSVELSHLSKNGESIIEEIAVTPIRDSNDNVSLILFTGRDVTERKRLFAELENAKKKAEEMNNLKSNFMSNVSHELRTPLVGVLGFAEVLKSSLSEPELKDLADTIITSGERLLRTVNLLLDMTQIESALTVIDKEEFDAAELLLECSENVQKLFYGKNLALRTILSEETFRVSTDKRMLTVIFNNIIENAFKFTFKGSIEIKLFSSTDERNRPGLCVEVSDTGIGINEDALSLIFEDFRQVSEGLSRQFEGNGLGLTITKKYVEMLGGRISVKSRVAAGSTFKIELPLAPVAHSSKPFPVRSSEEIQRAETPVPVSRETGLTPAPDTAGLPRILIIDDDSLVHGLLRIHFKNKAIVDYADNSAHAVEKLTQKEYALILLDINLGEVINGIDLLKIIRKMKEYENTPVVACTAYAMPGDRDKLLDSGFNDYVSKPFNVENLVLQLTGMIDK